MWLFAILFHLAVAAGAWSRVLDGVLEWCVDVVVFHVEPANNCAHQTNGNVWIRANTGKGAVRSNEHLRFDSTSCLRAHLRFDLWCEPGEFHVASPLAF